jgi:hypothetical protein
LPPAIPFTDQTRLTPVPDALVVHCVTTFPFRGQILAVNILELPRSTAANEGSIHRFEMTVQSLKCVAETRNAPVA